MRNEIEKQFELAWRDGARQVGESPNTDEAYAELQRLIDEELVYVQEFANAVQVAEKAITLRDIRRRVNIWANQFNRIVNRALLFFGKEKHLKWRLGMTEQHCQSCLSLDGHVATANDWFKANIYPQDKQLECGGWNCDCKLEVTELPLTRSPIPKVATKHDHAL
jgi:hypothetical protein